LFAPGIVRMRAIRRDAVGVGTRGDTRWHSPHLKFLADRPSQPSLPSCRRRQSSHMVHTLANCQALGVALAAADLLVHSWALVTPLWSHRGEPSQKRRGCHPEYHINHYPHPNSQIDRTAPKRPGKIPRTHRPGEVGVGLCLRRGVVQPHQQPAFCSMVHYTHRARARCGPLTPIEGLFAGTIQKGTSALGYLGKASFAHGAGVGCVPSVTYGVALASPVYGARAGAERGARRERWVVKRVQRGWAYRQSSRGHRLDAYRAYTKRGSVGFVRGTPQPVTPVEGDGDERRSGRISAAPRREQY
jgi:hypothetical protein